MKKSIIALSMVFVLVVVLLTGCVDKDNNFNSNGSNNNATNGNKEETADFKYKTIKIDVAGEVDYNLKFCGYFEDGIAFVKDEGGNGYVNTKGEWVIPPEHGNIGELSDGLMFADKTIYPDPNRYWYSENVYGYFDKNGVVIIPFNYQGADSFVNGLAPVKKMANGDLLTKTKMRLFHLNLMMLKNFPMGLPL